MNRPTFFALLLVALIGSLDNGSAALIVDNGPPDHRNGSEMTNWIQADDFTLSTATRVDSAKVWDIEINSSFAGSILWQIYSNSESDTPGTLLVSGMSANLSHTPTGFVPFGSFAEYLSTFDVGPIVLPAGVYWLALHNGPLSNNNGVNVFWEATNSVRPRANNELIFPYDGLWWHNPAPAPGIPTELAFQLNGAPVPTVSAFIFDKSPQITFTTTAGQNYRVEYQSDLSNPSWTSVAGAEMIQGDGNIVQVTDSDPEAGTTTRRFYRVVML